MEKSKNQITERRVQIKNYGKTKDFDPEKRIQIRFEHLWTDFYELVLPNKHRSTIIDFIRSENLNEVPHVKGFTFVPGTYLRIRYSGNNFAKPPGNLLPMIYRNLNKTSLTEDQIYQFASIMTTLRLTQRPYLNSASECFLRFVQNYFEIVADLVHREEKLKFNEKKAYESLINNAEKWNVMIPYYNEIIEKEPSIKLRIVWYRDGNANFIKNLQKELFPKPYDQIVQDIGHENKVYEGLVEACQTYEELVYVYKFRNPGFMKKKTIDSLQYINKTMAIRHTYKCPTDWKNCLVYSLIDKVFWKSEVMDIFSCDDILKRAPLNDLKKLLLRFSKLRFWDYSSVTSDTLTEIKLEPEEFDADFPSNTHEFSQFMQRQKYERELAFKQYSESVRLSLALGFGLPQNMFYTLDNILELYVNRRRESKYHRNLSKSFMKIAEHPKHYHIRTLIHPHDQCKLVPKKNTEFTGLGEITSPDDDEVKKERINKGYFRKLIDTVKQPFEGLRSTIHDTLDNFNETSESVNRVMEKISKKLENKGMTSAAQAFAQFDSSSISSGLSSVRFILDKLFSDMVKWVYDIFGFEVTINLQMSDILMAYLLWKNTTCSYMRMAVFGYLAAQMGILDIIMNVLKLAWAGIKKLFNGREETGAFEDVVRENEEFIRAKAKKLEEQSKGSGKENVELFEEEAEDKSMMDTILKALEDGTPVILGILVVALSGYMSYDASKKYETIGTKVVNFARNVMFIGGGLAGISVIVKNVVGIVKVATDYVKTYVFRSHETMINKIKRVTDFVTKTKYIPGVSNFVFARDPSAAILFMKDFSRIPALDKDVMSIEDVKLRTQYFQKRKDMIGMYGQVKAIIQTAIAGAEIFHVQFYSRPGAGKTDLSHSTIKAIAAHMREIKKVIEQDDYDELLEFSDNIYYMVEGAKYHDCYYGQKLVMIDEMNYYDAEEMESIQFKLGFFSGKPTMANKAAVEDKGMIFNVDLVVSNTNNEYPRPEGMVNPTALWRRRVLIETVVKPEFLGKDGLPDDDKIMKAGIDRTRSEHLFFNFKDPMKDTGDSYLDGLTNLTYDQMIKMLKLKVHRHMLVEQDRLSKRAFKFHDFRTKINNLIAKVESSTFEVPELDALHKKFNEVLIRLEKKQLADFAEPSTHEEILGDLEHTRIESFQFVQAALENIKKASEFEGTLEELLKEMGSRKHDGTPECKEFKEPKCDRCWYEKIMKFYRLHRDSQLLHTYVVLNEDNGVSPKERVQQPPTKEEQEEETDFPQSFYDMFEETGFDYARTNMYYTKLEKAVHNGTTYYGLSEGEFYTPREAYDSDSIDVQKLVVRKVDGKDRILYKGSIEPETRDQLLIILRMIEGQGSHKNAKLEIDRIRRRFKLKAIHTTYFDKIKMAMKSVWEDVKHVLMKFVSKAMDIMSDGVTSAIIGFALVLGVFAGFYTIGRILGPRVEPTSAYNPVIRARKPGGIEFTSLDDESKPDDYLRKSQAVLIRLSKDETKIVDWINIVCVEGSIYLVPYHFIRHFNGNEKIVFYDPLLSKGKNSDSMIRFDLKASDFHQIGKKDASLVALPKVRQLVSAKKHFITQEDISNQYVNFTTFQAYAQAYTVPNNYKDLTFQQFEKQKAGGIYVTNMAHSKPDPEDNSFVMDDVAKIKMGHSGGLAVHTNTKMQSRNIVGIISARDVVFHSPYGHFITQEELDEGISHMPKKYRFVTTSLRGIPLPEDHHLYHVFEDKETLIQASKDRSISETSGFAKTPIHGEFPVESEPAILNAADKRIIPGSRHPLQVSLNKSNGKEQPYISQEEKEFMIKSLVYHFEKQFGLVTRTLRVYDTAQAITGTREFGSVPINIHSSAGLPYSEMPGVVGKQPFIKVNLEKRSYDIQQLVFDDVETYELQYQNCRIPPNIKLEFVKKELVGPNKIENPKTRTVGTGNMIQQIIYNKKNRGIQLMMKNVWKQGGFSSFAMGLDLEVHGDQMVRALKWTDYLFDFDVKAWESAINLELLEMSNDVTNLLLDKSYQARGVKSNYDYKQTSQGLVIDYTHAHVQFKDVLYTKRSGLLSGHPGTFIENSNIHVMLLYLIIRRILIKEGKPHYANASFIYNNVKFIVAGDDVLLAVGPLLRSVLTPGTMKEGYASVGFEITSADKTPDITVKNIEQVQFLKHEFKMDDSGYYHTMPLTSIIYQLFNWHRTDTKLQKDELIAQNYYDAFRYSWFRGRNFYEDTREKFNMANLNNKMSWTYSYDEFAAIIRQERIEEEFFLSSRDQELRFLNDHTYPAMEE